jgi:hypothetical protein
LLAVVFAAPAAADPAGEKRLAAVDAAMNRARTNHFVYDAVTLEPGRAEKRLGLEVWIKGERRLTEFLAPADLKGTKVLVMSPTEMYAYLPAFGKVRRIASHTTDQSAFGMAFSQDDLADQRYGDEYVATLASEDETQARLVLTPRPGAKPAYGRIELTVILPTSVPGKVEYYASSGTLQKTETRSNYACQGDVCVPGELYMIDHTKGGLSTRITQKSWKLNEELPDSLLSKRSLDK